MVRRANYLLILIGSDYLFECVRAFAWQTSANVSLFMYGKAITEVATRMRRYVTGKTDHEILAHPAFHADRARLVALCFMQRAHPGMDLHQTLINLCEKAVQWCHANKLEKTGWEVRLRLFQNMMKGSNHWETSISEYVEALSSLSREIMAATHNSRWEVIHRCEAFFTAWRGSPDARDTLILTEGYSRMVRDVLKCGIFEHLNADRDRVFVAVDKENELDGRIMEFELREDRRWLWESEMYERSGTASKIGSQQTENALPPPADQMR